MSRASCLSFAASIALSGIGLAACSDSDSKPDVPTVVGQDASVAVEVDCGADGVANVNVKFGQIDDDVLIGRNALTRSVGGSNKFSRKYGIASGYDETLLTVTTRPTTGTCKTTLTDYESGNLVGERETAGQAVLKVALKPKD